MPQYEMIDHTADMGVLIYGESQEDVFLNAAAMLLELLVDRLPETGAGAPAEIVTISLEGTDQTDLLIRWLSEILYFFEVEEKMVTGVDIDQLTETKVTVRWTLTPFDYEKHGLGNQIKAATYHQAAFEAKENGWRARIIFDL